MIIAVSPHLNAGVFRCVWREELEPVRNLRYPSDFRRNLHIIGLECVPCVRLWVLGPGQI